MRAVPAARPLLLAGVLLGALALRVGEPRILQSLIFSVFDELQRVAPRSYEPVPVRIVDLDDASLERVGQWPWPRTQVADLVDALREQGAAVIAFDVVFSEPDRTSPARVVDLWPEEATGPELRERVRALPDHDARLAEAMAWARVVTAFSLTGEPGGRAPQRDAGFSWLGPDPRAFLAELPGSVTTLPELEAAGVGNGNFSLRRAEAGGVYRRIPLVFHHQGELHPALAAEALRVAFGASTFVIRSAGAGGEDGPGGGAGPVESTGITHVRVGKIAVPTDERGRMWIHFTEPVPERFVPAWRVLAGEVDPALLEGHIVFVGTSAAGLADLRATPLQPAAPGVTLHAQAAEQILLQHFLVRPDWALGAELVYMLVLGVLLVVAQRRLGAAGSALLAVAAVAGVVLLSLHAFTSWRWLLDPVYPSLVAVAVYLAGSLQSYLRTEAERRRIRHAFGHYLSPALVDALAEHPERLRLGGEERTLTVLFCDVRGFTAISERVGDPEALTRLVNRFLTPLTEAILERGGTIDKYIGDCIMAFWNAPLDDPDHARHAGEAALVMLERLEALNALLGEEAGRESRAAERLRVGIGINTGECCVGNLGSEHRFDYSAIGDEVNLASRLEGRCKEYGVDVLLGENTVREAPELAAVPIDRVRVQGRATPVLVFALAGGTDVADEPRFDRLRDAHESLLRHYRAREWDAAESALARARDTGFPLERVWDLYAERIERHRRLPPPADWDGVHEAETK